MKYGAKSLGRKGWRCLLVFAALHGPLHAQEGGEETSEEAEAPEAAVVLEDVQIQVATNERLAYEIDAVRGTIRENSQVVAFEQPHVRLFDDAGNPREVIEGERGDLLPVEIETVDEDGNPEKIRKYDWALRGNVSYVSTEGHALRTPELFFANATRSIVSNSGVELKLPDRKGNSIYAKARRLEVELGEEGPSLETWKLIGNVSISTKPPSR